jgi:hypothetical protein
MTQNQISYFNWYENARHNKVVEQETGRHNAVTEQEAMRHNKEDEDIRKRTNTLTDSHYRHSDAETRLNNMLNRGLEYSRLNETRRSNLAKERENLRSDMAQESLGRERNALTAREIAESVRHNKAVETENVRHNMYTEDVSNFSAKSSDVLNKAKALESISSSQLKDAQYALTDTEASLNYAKINNLNAQTKTEGARYYSTLADTGLKHAQTELSIVNAQYKPLDTAASLMQGFGRLFGSVNGLQGLQGLGTPSTTPFQSSVNYDAATGLFY